MDEATRANTEAFIEQVAAVHGIALLTLEPHDGLAAVTDEAAADLGDLLARAWTDHGVPTFVRFAHEMNGTWYPWSQQPAAYIAAFRRVAAAVHERSPSSAMIWAPNQGVATRSPGGTVRGGPRARPTRGPRHEPRRPARYRGRPVCAVLPGRRRGRLDRRQPLPLGSRLPVGRERAAAARRPSRRCFAGRHWGAPGRWDAVPDLYATYADGARQADGDHRDRHPLRPVGHGTGPSETRPEVGLVRPGLSATTTRTEFPRIGMINWFEWRKQESGGRPGDRLAPRIGPGACPFVARRGPGGLAALRGE